MKVAMQGEKGSLSHEAAHRALVPIENFLAGSIHENYDRLSELPLHIVAELEDDPLHFTGFLVRAREPGPIEGATKTSLDQYRDALSG